MDISYHDSNNHVHFCDFITLVDDDYEEEKMQRRRNKKMVGILLIE